MLSIHSLLLLGCSKAIFFQVRKPTIFKTLQISICKKLMLIVISLPINQAYDTKKEKLYFPPFSSGNLKSIIISGKTQRHLPDID